MSEATTARSQIGGIWLPRRAGKNNFVSDIYSSNG